MDKATVRTLVREQRRARAADDQARLAEQLAVRAVAFLPDQPRDVTCYSSIEGEPGTGPLIARLLASGHRVWLPRIVGPLLAWVRVDAGSAFESGPMGINQPV
ncbi:MAG: 5-formyltetrahydrofolate cyclo-ligase, partial [bacterium]|nr:5-formyltetrahydrofolate cyclo-ligase [bacterium]